MTTPRVVVLNDWITPYRLPLFERLGRSFQRLTVLFSAERVREYAWSFPSELSFRSEVLPRIELRWRRPPYGEPRIIFLNPTLPLRLARLRPDVVVSYAFSLPTLAALCHSRLSRTPLVSWSNGTAHTERHVGALQRLARRVVVRHSAAAVTGSELGRENYLAYGAPPERVFLVPQLPDLEWFAQGAQKAREEAATYREHHGLDGKIVLYVGTLSELKGIRGLVEAFARVRRRVPGTSLLLAGDGPIRGALERQAEELGLSDAVHFTGFVPQAELVSIYAAADLFAFPTLQDTFGTVLVEAAATGLPIVASQFAGATPGYVRPGENGAIVDPRDPRSLAGAIVRLLRDPARRAMGEASRRLAFARDNDHVARRFAEAIRCAHAMAKPSANG